MEDTLQYNTQRSPLRIPEYGRHIQKMVDQAMEEPKKEQRNKMAHLETPKMACKLQLINNTTSTSSITLIDATGSNNILPQVSASMNMYLLQST